MVSIAKTEDLTEKTNASLVNGLADAKRELFNLRFRNAMRQLDDPLTIRYTRRDLARCMSALSEHRKGIRKLAGGDDV